MGLEQSPLNQIAYTSSLKKEKFIYDGREVELRELPVLPFLAVIEAFLNNDVEVFFNNLNFSEEDRIIFFTQELFEKLFKDFVDLHNESEGEGRKTKSLTLIELIFTIRRIVKVFAEIFHSHPEEVGNRYSLRQMVLWLTSDKKKSTGNDGFYVPPNAKGVKYFKDEGGNQSVRYRIET